MGIKIIDRLPLLEEDWIVSTPDGAEEVKPYQIIVLVSIADHGALSLAEDARRFPAILDTGNNHNFAIRQEQLDRWVPSTPRRKGWVELSGSVIPRLAANVWIHPNQPGTVEPSGEPPHLLELEEGVIVHPPDVPNPARLPILGLRALIRNKLRLTIDGDPREVDLEAPSA